MRQRYPTDGVVLGRRPVAEESVLLSILTKEVGLVHARAQGLRKSGAKLASALQTLTEAEVSMVLGRDGWRVNGAVLRTNWFTGLPSDARTRAARVATLILRLVPGEEADPSLYTLFHKYLEALRDMPLAAYEALECLAVLRILATLGLDAGELPGEGGEPYAIEALRDVERKRTSYVARANAGISASGL